MNSLMEKNNDHFVNEKETDLLVKKIEIEWDFQSEESQSETQSFLQLPSPRFSQEHIIDKKRPKKKKKKKKNNFSKPIESEEVKRDFLTNFDLDFENQIDKDIFVQYGEFSDYISLFNQKFNRPEKKICKFSLERLSKSVKKLLVFGEHLENLSDLFNEKKDDMVNIFSDKTSSINNISDLESKTLKSINSLDNIKNSYNSTWKNLQKKLSLKSVELMKIPPGLDKFINKTENSKFKLQNLNPYQQFIEMPKEEKKSVLSLSSKNILPNLKKSRGQVSESNAEDLGDIILNNKQTFTQNQNSKIDPIPMNQLKNSFLTQGVNSDKSSLHKLNSLSTMNQTRGTDKEFNYFKSKNDSTFEIKESVDEVEGFDIYENSISKNEINKIINRLKPDKNGRFSEVIKNRCSLKPKISFKSENKPAKSFQNSEESLIQINVISCGDPTSEVELRPKRSIFSHMNNMSKNDFFSINEPHHISEEEEDESSSQLFRDNLKTRTSKLESKNNHFLLPISINQQVNQEQSGNLIKTEEPSKMIKMKSMNSDSKKKNKFISKSGKKLKLKKKKFLKEYIPQKKRINNQVPSNTSLYQSSNLTPPSTQPIELKQNQTLNPHNYPEYGQTPNLSISSNTVNHRPYPQIPLNHQSHNYIPQYGHYPIPPVPINHNMMPRYPQPRMQMYPQNGMYMPPMYQNYPNFQMQNGGFMGNPMYMQNQPVYHNMQQGYIPQMKQNSTNQPVQNTTKSYTQSNGENLSSEVNSFTK